MNLTVLADNNTFIDRYFLGEPAVSYFIEADGQRILFDVGYSDAFMANARKLEINLLDADWLVLSHGHLDHTRGLGPLMRLYADKGVERRDVKRPRLVAHPGALKRKKSRDGTDIGFLHSEEALAGYFDLQVSREPVRLTERLTFLGEIERTLDFEAQGPMGTVVDSDGERDDWLLDDSALAYRSSRGLVIITGCAHAGICNVVEQARRVCGDERIVDIVGGLHLLNPPDRRLQKTVEFLQAVGPEKIHACHCTDLRSKIALAGSLVLEEVGVGLRLVYP